MRDEDNAGEFREREAQEHRGVIGSPLLVAVGDLRFDRGLFCLDAEKIKGKG